MTEPEKKVEQVELYATISASVEIKKEFDRLFNILFMVDKDAAITKADVNNVLDAFSEYQITKGVKDGICDKKGEPI